MSLGEAIFSSSILISCVYLLSRYLTKSNWKRFVIIISLLIFGIPAIGSTIYFGIQKYQSIPKKINEYWNIKLGDSFKDVIFFKQQPQVYKIIGMNPQEEIISIDVLEFIEMKDELRKNYTLCPYLKEMFPENNKEKIKTEEIINALKNPNECIAWQYNEKNSSSHLTYQIGYNKNGLVRYILCSTSDSYLSCPRIFSIGIGSTYQEVIDIFGIPATGYSNLKEGEIRTLEYPKYNATFYLYHGKVYRFGIYRE